MCRIDLRDDFTKFKKDGEFRYKVGSNHAPGRILRGGRISWTGLIKG